MTPGRVNEPRVERAVTACQSNAWPEDEPLCAEILGESPDLVDPPDHWVRRYDCWRNILSRSS